MPPRRETTLEQIEHRLGGIEARMERLETGPHTGCPSPVLQQRVVAVEDGVKRINGNVAEVRDEMRETRADMTRAREERATQYGTITTKLASVETLLAKTKAEILDEFETRMARRTTIIIAVVGTAVTILSVATTLLLKIIGV